MTKSDFPISTSTSSTVATGQQPTSLGSVINFNNCVYDCENFNNKIQQFLCYFNKYL